MTLLLLFGAGGALVEAPPYVPAGIILEPLVAIAREQLEPRVAISREQLEPLKGGGR